MGPHSGTTACVHSVWPVPGSLNILCITPLPSTSPRDLRQVHALDDTLLRGCRNREADMESTFNHTFLFLYLAFYPMIV